MPVRYASALKNTWLCAGRRRVEVDMGEPLKGPQALAIYSAHYDYASKRSTAGAVFQALPMKPRAGRRHDCIKIGTKSTVGGE